MIEITNKEIGCNVIEKQIADEAEAQREEMAAN